MIPKKILHNRKIYNFIKEYSNVLLYEEENTKFKECFTKADLGLVKNNIKIRNKNVFTTSYGQKLDYRGTNVY